MFQTFKKLVEELGEECKRGKSSRCFVSGWYTQEFK
jgi:hypothetical protein